MAGCRWSVIHTRIIIRSILNKNRFTSKGALHITRNDLISSNINVDKDFILSYYNVREFENTHSDNFSLDTKIVC